MRDTHIMVNAENRITAMADTWGTPKINKRIKCEFVLSYTEDSGKFILQYNLDCDGIWWIMEQFWDFPYFDKTIEDFPESIIKWKGYCKINKKGEIFWQGAWDIKYLNDLWEKQ